MKIPNHTIRAALVGVAFWLSAQPLPAQYKAIGDDGIAASPKLRMFLEERRQARAAASQPSDPIHHCRGCGATDLTCCNTKTGANAATPGMAKGAEPAPLNPKEKEQPKREKKPSVWWYWAK